MLKNRRTLTKSKKIPTLMHGKLLALTSTLVSGTSYTTY